MDLYLLAKKLIMNKFKRMDIKLSVERALLNIKNIESHLNILFKLRKIYKDNLEELYKIDSIIDKMLNYENS